MASTVTICGRWTSFHMHWRLQAAEFSAKGYFFGSIFLPWLELLHLRHFWDGNKFVYSCFLLSLSFSPFLFDVWKLEYHPGYWIPGKLMLVTEVQAEEFHISSKAKQNSDFSNMEAQIIQHRVCTQIRVSSQRTSPGFTRIPVARKAFGLDISRKVTF